MQASPGTAAMIFVTRRKPFVAASHGPSRRCYNWTRPVRPLYTSHRQPPHPNPGSCMATAAAPRAEAEAPAYQPYVSAARHPAELTVRALVLGALLGIVFAASSVYLA